MAFLTVFMWLCLALFAAAGVIWLLDMVGVLTIRTSTQRTMLNASLGTTLLGGMASFAVATFFTAPEQEPEQPGQAPGAQSPSPTPSPAPTGAPTGAAPPSAAPSPSPSDEPAAPVAADPALSQPVRDYLSANNLTRPMIDPQWAAQYPPCAKQSRTVALLPSKARGCFAELNRFNTSVLLPYADAYERYVAAVTEESFRQPAGELLDFLRTEADGFTNGTNQVAALYRDISVEWDEDYRRLRRQGFK